MPLPGDRNARHAGNEACDSPQRCRLMFVQQAARVLDMNGRSHRCSEQTALHGKTCMPCGFTGLYKQCLCEESDLCYTVWTMDPPVVCCSKLVMQVGDVFMTITQDSLQLPA